MVSLTCSDLLDTRKPQSFRLVPGPPRKRPREDDAAEEYLKGPLATSAPSAVAKHNAVCDMQKQPGLRVANDRPSHSDTDQLPIALLYHGFGHFLDLATGALTDPMLDIERREFEENINQREFEENIDGFMTSMNAYYTKEDHRRSHVLRCFNNIFQCCLGDHTQNLVAGMVREGRHSGGHVLGPAGTIEVVMEVKNELSSGGADPVIEFAACYTQSLMDEPTLAVLSHFVFPALGIVVIGQYRVIDHLVCELIDS
jgi:hypothetical protein